MCSLPRPRFLPDQGSRPASPKENASINQAASGVPWTRGATGQRPAGAITESLARDVDAAEIGCSGAEKQAALRFGVCLHQSSDHADCLPAAGRRGFEKIQAALVSDRPPSVCPVTFSPPPGIRDVDFGRAAQTLRPGHSDLISPNEPRYLRSKNAKHDRLRPWRSRPRWSEVERRA